ncbi:DNA-binding IclR family transcriptional regulator [Lipingzhangella halophila]|uniref:DNA-binding IclR family transcriptional regulator n=1 Tax=Lipingzhangella halophila TaxID=1783352 RepID=A0A7W7W5Y3_9ACTN|nr:IclR family transcriptional regulator [Lipingzhangella halophila]MBB4935218.1 DNA-binding IclR family transcriptional regulator [Lipingzhangella halophila]
MTGPEGAGGVRSVQRALEILNLLDENHAELSIREIVEATQLPKTTVLRLLHTLERNQLLSVSDEGRYCAGAGLLRWSRLAEQRWRLPEDGHEVLRGLAREHHETVHVYVRQDLDRVCIAQAEGTRTLRHVVQVGDALPLWAGGVAKVLLTDAPDDLLARVARRSPFGDSHMATLRTWVADASRNGYAVSHGEREEGLSAVAVPIHDKLGGVGAALSFGGPTSRFTDERVRVFVSALQEAASLLGEAR